MNGYNVTFISPSGVKQTVHMYARSKKSAIKKTKKDFYVLCIVGVKHKRLG